MEGLDRNLSMKSFKKAILIWALVGALIPISVFLFAVVFLSRSYLDGYDQHGSGLALQWGINFVYSIPVGLIVFAAGTTYEIIKEKLW